MEIFNDQIVQILVNYFDNVKRVKLVVTSGELAIFVPIMDEIVVLWHGLDEIIKNAVIAVVVNDTVENPNRSSAHLVLTMVRLAVVRIVVHYAIVVVLGIMVETTKDDSEVLVAVDVGEETVVVVVVEHVYDVVRIKMVMDVHLTNVVLVELV